MRSHFKRIFYGGILELMLLSSILSCSLLGNYNTERIEEREKQFDRNFDFSSSDESTFQFRFPKLAYEEGYRENLFVDLNNEGNIWAEYQFGGPNVMLGGETLDIIKNNFPEEFNAFIWGDWWLAFPYSEGDYNSHVNLVFETADHNQARTWGNWMMDFLNAFLYTDYYEEGVNSWDENWDGTWHSLTEVRFATTVQWPMILEDFNDLIPRTYGGIAETLDITEANALKMWMWNGGDRFYQSFGAGWNSQVDKISGGFNYEIRDFIPFTTLQRSPYQATEDPLSISWSLPSVENLNYTIGAWEDYTPNEEEPWNVNGIYSVHLDIFGGDVYSDFSIEFDYTFTPYDTLPIERAYVTVNPYGYDLATIQIQHVEAKMFDLDPYLPSLSNLIDYQLHIQSFNTHHEGNFPYAQLELSFLEPGNYETEVMTLVSDLESTFNWEHEYVNNWTNEYWDWYWRFDTNLNVEHWNIGFNTSYDFTNFTTSLTNSWIYSQSNMLQNVNLTAADAFIQRGEFDPRMGGYWSNQVQVYWNSIDMLTQDPIKFYSEFDGSSHQFSMAEYFGWTAINVSDGFYRTETNVRLPIWDIDTGYDLVFPHFNNGYGFHCNYWWDWDYTGQLFVETYLELYTNNAFYEEADIEYNVSNYWIDFDFDFVADDIDIIPPGGDFGWYNSTLEEPIFPGHYQYDEKWQYSNVERITFNAWDNTGLDWWGSDVFNGTDEWGDPIFYNRFPTSDIINVTMDLYWSDLPIFHDNFHWFYPMLYNESWNYWYSDLDTTQFADGWYSLNAEITDAAFNTGWSGRGIEIDNYNESFSQFATVEFIGSSPLNNSMVSDIVTIQLNLTDDIGVFAAVYTKDGAGFVLDEDNYVSDGIYEIQWNTWAEDENSWHLFSITVWDMEGHKTIVYYSLQVDNYHAGEPPIIDIINPSEAGLILEDVVVFTANVSDDWGLSSVQGYIDTRGKIDMIFDETSELWEFVFNVSTLVNGSHTFTVRALDIDDPQNINEESIDFLVNNSVVLNEAVPPEYRNVIPGNFTSASDIFQSNISFSIEVMDDMGIESVNIQIYEVTGVNPIDVNSPGDVSLTNIRILTGYPQNMDLGTTTDGWAVYTNTWDTSQASSGIYLAEIQISDIDANQSTVTVKMLVILQKSSINENPFGDIPGYSLPFLFGLMGVAILGILHKNRH